MIKFFAQDSSVERIFINPIFKKKLCLDSGALKLTTEEQHKMRAWWGHDDHIHIRLKCPSDSPLCVSQNPIPAGNGCGDDDLNWWFTDEARAGAGDDSWDAMKSIYLDKIKKLPAQCSFYNEIF